LKKDEIKHIHFLDKELSVDTIKPQLKNRIEKSIQAKQDDTLLYYETDYR